MARSLAERRRRQPSGMSTYRRIERPTFMPMFSSKGDPTRRVAPTKKIVSIPCTVIIAAKDGTKRQCGLPAHYIAGGQNFCREKHQELAFATAKKSYSRAKNDLSDRELALLAACQ